MGLLSKKGKIDGGRAFQGDEGGWFVRYFCGFSPPATYDEDKAAKFILNGRMAPFYGGAESDSSEGSQELVEEGVEASRDERVKTRPSNALVRSSKRGFAGVDTAENYVAFKPLRKIKFTSDGISCSFLKLWLASKAVECPICCLFFPMNINRTSCCHQPICSACFVHLRLNPRTRFIKCPYCNKERVKVYYLSPSLLLFDKDLIQNSQLQTVSRQDLNLPPPPAHTYYQPETRYISNSTYYGFY